jgi:UDP-N-acetyl-D-glucosamine dehydrogenase
MDDSAEAVEIAALERRLRDRSAALGVIGLGYVGLPLARTAAMRGFRVLGFDIDAAKVAELNAGRSYIRR